MLRYQIADIDNAGNADLQFLGAPGPSIFAENTFNIRDTVSKVVNTHNIRFGADIYKEQRLDGPRVPTTTSITFGISLMTHLTRKAATSIP